MKKFITIITLVGLLTPVFAQNTARTSSTVLPTNSTRSIVASFFASEEWQRAFVGHWGVLSGVEPGIPENQAEREALGQIRDILRPGTDAAVIEAARVLDTLIATRRQANAAPSPMILQIAGTLHMRMAEIATTDTQRQQATERAITLLRQSVDPTTGFPNFLRAHKNLANLLFRTESPDGSNAALARDHFIRAIELGDRDAVTFGLLGAIYLDEGRLISAESALRNALMINPRVIEFKQLLGQVLLQQERFAEARDVFSELLQRRPNDTNFWMAQANAFVALDQIDEAAKNLEIVRFMGGANAAVLMLLGDVYMNKDMTIEAHEVYLEAIAMDPSMQNLDRFVRAAESLSNFGAYELAMSVVNAIDAAYGDRLSEKEDINLLSLRSEINLSLGQTEEAVANLEDLLRKDPFNARALLTLARYYSNLEPDESLTEEQRRLQERRNQQRAILLYERAQNLEDVRAQVRAYIGEAQLRVQRNELQRAAELLETAQSLQFQDYIQAYLEQIRAAVRARRG